MLGSTGCLKLSVMRKKLKNNLIAALAVIFLLAIAVTAAYALLLHETKVDSSVAFGEISPNATDFILSHDLDMKFDSPGSVHELKMNVKSYAGIPLQYSYRFEIDTLKSNGLEKAIFVFINNEYVGTLASIISSGENLTYEKYLLAKTDNVIDEINDIIKLELHNGAQGSWADGKSCDIKVKFIAKTIDYSTNIFVTDEDELRLALDDVNNSSNVIKTVRICNDINLTADINIANGTIIDFLGGKFLADSHNVNIVPNKRGGTNVVKFISSRNVYYDDVNPSDTIILNAADMAIELGENALAVGKIITVLRCDEEKANEITAEKASKILFNGISEGYTANILGGYGFYVKDGVFEVFASNNSNYTYADGIIAANSVEATTVTDITIGNIKVEFAIYPRYNGNEENISRIIDNELRHIAELSMDGVINELTYDIFLPTSIPRYGISITWLSDAPAILNADGKCGDNAEGDVKLTAVIRYNRDIIIKNYNISVYKQSNQMRFDYLVARIGEKKLSALYDAVTEPEGSFFKLPITANIDNTDDYRNLFDMGSIGLKSLNYQINPNNSFLNLISGNKVVMNEATFENYAEVTIRGVFKNEPNKIYEDTIPVEIKLVDNQNLHTAIVEYLQKILDGTDILQNILSTRAIDGMGMERGDFTLPGYYKGYNINFALTDGTATYTPDGIIKNITSENDSDGHANFTFKIDAQKFKNKAHTVEFFVKIKISAQDESSLPESISALYVNVPPAIHNIVGDIENSSLFYSLKLQVIDGLKSERGVPKVGAIISEELSNALSPNYILLYDMEKLNRLKLISGSNIYDSQIANQALSGGDDGYYLNINANSVNTAFNALDKLNIKELTVINDLNANIFGNDDNGASKFVAFIKENYVRLDKLTINNCIINNPKYFTGMPTLNYIDLQGCILNDFDWINVMQNNDLAYLDISGTNFDTTQQFDIIIAAYYSYVLRHNEILPDYYYSVEGVRTLYLPTQDLNYRKLIFYLYCLEQITDLKWEYTQLVSKIYGAENEVLTINWSISTGDEEKAVIVKKTNTNVESLVLQNLLFNTASTGGKIYETVTLNAEITLNGVSAKRIFKINMYYKA